MVPFDSRPGAAASRERQRYSQTRSVWLLMRAGRFSGQFLQLAAQTVFADSYGNTNAAMAHLQAGQVGDWRETDDVQSSQLQHPQISQPLHLRIRRSWFRWLQV